MPPALIAWLYQHRSEIEIAAAVLAVTCLALVWTLHSEHVGAAKCEQRDEAKVVTELRGDIVESGRQSDAISDEAAAYARAISEPVRAVPDVRLCVATTAADRVPKAAAAGVVGDGSLGRGASDSERARELADLKASYERLAKIGQHANAQLGELRAYVLDVCRPAPALDATR